MSYWDAHVAYIAEVPDPICCDRPMLKVDSGKWKRQGYREWMCWACERHEKRAEVSSVSVTGPMPGPGDCD